MEEQESINPEIVTLGFCSIDYLFQIDRYPLSGEKIQLKTFEFQGGGQAATAAIALSCWGCDVRFVGRVGDDQPGSLSLSWLQENRVCTDAVIVTPETKTQFAIIAIDQSNGERTIFWHRPKNLNLTLEDLRPEWFENIKVLLEDAHEIDAAIYAAERVSSHGGKVVLDAEEIGPGRDHLLSFADVCVGSSDFGAKEFGEQDPEKTIKILRGFGVKIAGVTLGCNGCIADWGRGIRKFPGMKINALDTTGAGDIFHAALAFGVFKQWAPEKIFPFANVCAALSCCRIGGRSGIPSKSELMRYGYDL